MILKRSFKFSYSFLTSCEHVPRWLLPHLQSNVIGKIRLQSASDVHTWVCRKLQTMQALHRKSSQRTGFSDQYFRQVSQNYLATEYTFKFCSFLQLIAGNTFVFLCYSILEIHVWSLFSPLKESKNISSQMESLHPELAYKGSDMITWHR